MTRTDAQLSHADKLTALARSPAEPLKAVAENLLAELDGIDVLQSRTGLVMLPLRDTAQGTAFHLGEVLVSEAHIRMGPHEGYGMRRGRDLEAAMAMALVDLAMAAGRGEDACRTFVAAQVRAQAAEDHETLCRVEATRVDMETF